MSGELDIIIDKTAELKILLQEAITIVDLIGIYLTDCLKEMNKE